jgi:hypothetical protein
MLVYFSTLKQSLSSSDHDDCAVIIIIFIIITEKHAQRGNQNCTVHPDYQI